jgi:hypothetical protein
VGPSREAPTVVFGDPQASPSDLPPENPIFFNQIGECVPLLPIEPTGHTQEQKSKDRYVDHERKLTSGPRFWAETQSAETWDTTPFGIVSFAWLSRRP